MAMRAPSLDDIRAGFVFTALDTIVGEPTYKSIELAHNQCIRNATTVDSQLGGGHHGHSGMVEFPDVYFLRTAFHFNRPNHPGDTPPYLPGMETAAREACNALFDYNTKVFLTCQRVEKVLMSMLENAIDTTFLSGIHDPAHGFGHRTIIDIFRYLFETYGNIGPADIVANQHKMTAAVDPNQPIAHLFKQLENCQKFAAAGQTPITPQQVIKAAETLILQTGKYTVAYREWLGLPTVEKTYLNFKTRMTAEYCLQNQIHTTAREAGYTHQANAAIDVHPDEDHLAAAANEFASATAADRVAFATLATTNGDLNSQMANMAMQNQQMQAQMGQMQQHLMYLAAAPPPPAYQHRDRTGRNSRNRNRDRRPAQQPAHTAAQPPAWQQPAASPWQPPAGSANARTPSQQQLQPPPMQQQYQQYQPPPPYQPPQRQYGQGSTGHGQGNASYGQEHVRFQRQPRQQRMPNAKYYNNTNYCWSHGGDIANEHMSHTCQRPAAGHNPHATRGNTMGGNPKDLQRIWMGT
jgi:hypothetical protein